MHTGKRGLTLLEVVVALGLVATLLVTMLVAHGRLTRQQRRAERQTEAIAAADQLLASWMATSPMVIPARRGIIEEPSERRVTSQIVGQPLARPPLEWQIQPVAMETATIPGTQVLRLEVFERETAASVMAPRLLAQVEFLSTAPLPAEAIR